MRCSSACCRGNSLPCVKGGGICEANDGGIVIPSRQIQPKIAGRQMENENRRFFAPSKKWGYIINKNNGGSKPPPYINFTNPSQPVRDYPSSTIFDGPPPPPGRCYNPAGFFAERWGWRSLRWCGNIKKENGLPRLLRRLAMTDQCHSEQSEESVSPKKTGQG